MDAGLSNVRCIAAESLGHMADTLGEMKFSIGKPNPCNDHIYHFHASELLNLIVGCAGRCRHFREFGPTQNDYDM